MLKKVSPNDPMEIPATTYNAFIDAARAFQQNKGFKSKASSHSTPYFIHNATGKKLPIYSVLMVTDIALELPDTADEDVVFNAFIGMPIVLKGEVPDKTSRFFTNICITQEPLDVDGVGLGIMDGLAKCSAKINNTSDYDIPTGATVYLRPEDQNTDNLILDSFGSIECVYSFDSNTEDRPFPAIANMGGSVMPFLIPIELIWKSGEPSDTSYVSYIYDININGTIARKDIDISIGDNPYRRPQDYNVTKATQGLGFYNSEGHILVAWCNEYPIIGDPEVLA